MVKVSIVIDVFRAFTTACVVLEKNPSEYYVTNHCKTVLKLSKTCDRSILLGKAGKGSDVVYTTFNSPTRVGELDLKKRVVIHRTTAGGTGLISVKKGRRIFAAAFANADATVIAVRTLKPESIRIIPMGHEGTTPSLEDTLCAEYIQGLLEGKRIRIDTFFPKLKEDSGKYFFGEDQNQYPEEDFYHCLSLNRYNFAIVVEVIEDVAKLSKSVLNDCS